MTQPEQEAREMLAIQAAQAVDAIFEDLRDRRFLKWLFAADPANRGSYGDLDKPLGLEVQHEIREAWQQIIENAFAARPTAGIADADIERTARELWWPHHASRTRVKALADLDAGSVGEVTLEFADVVSIVREVLARPTTGIDREVLGRLIDPDAWHETLPTDGCGTYWMSRRYNARQKADAILALLPTPAKTGERAIVRDFLISLTDGGKNRANTLSIKYDELVALVKRSRAALEALSQPLPDAPIVSGEGS